MKMMKATTIFSITMMLLTTGLWAGINIKAGPTISKMDVGHYGAAHHKIAPAYRGSVFYSIPILETTALEPGISFTNEACQYYHSRSYMDLKVNFLKLDMLVNVQIAPTRFHFITGPYLALRVGEENLSMIKGGAFKAENRTGWGLVMGVRFYFKESRNHHPGLFIELLGDLGLTKFQNEIGVYRTPYYQGKNASLMIGYGF